LQRMDGWDRHETDRHDDINLFRRKDAKNAKSFYCFL